MGYIDCSGEGVVTLMAGMEPLRMIPFRPGHTLETSAPLLNELQTYGQGGSHRGKKYC